MRTPNLRRPLLVLALVALFLPPQVMAEEKQPAKPKDGVFVQRAGGKMLAGAPVAGAASLRLGQGIRGTAKPHVTDWFGTKAISGQVNVVNPTDTERHAAVTFIVYDKDGRVIAAASQSQSLDPKEEVIWGGFVLKMPKARLQAVASYEYIWYEDTQAIGKR